MTALRRSGILDTMKSPKERSLDGAITRFVSGRPRQVAQMLLADKEIQALQDYANTVAIKRLGYNDHGPVHMRKVMLNAVTMMGLLHDAGKLVLFPATYRIAYKEECAAPELAQ